MKKSEIYTIPNLFSFIRIFLVIPIFYYISKNESIIALIFVLLAFISDSLDGYFARRLNQISEVGKILDPMADKICTSGGFVALSLYYNFPIWLTVMIIGRDLLIILGSVYLIDKKNVVAPSNRIGKITVALISLLAIVVLLNINILYKPLLISVVVMLVISLYYYILVFKDNTAHARKSSDSGSS
jgi:CDP-diacylglycerol--glycerol-3-phosphate 3-phosphatidyltransferase